MNNTIADFVVGDQVRVVFGAFEGLCGEVLEIHRSAKSGSAFDESCSSCNNMFLVKMNLGGRDFVIDFPSEAIVSRHQLATALSVAD